MGRQKKPTALKVAGGTDKRNKQRHNQNEPDCIGVLGPPPDHLDDEQKELWDELHGLVHDKVAGQADRIAFEIMVVLLHDFRKYYVDFSGAKLARLEAMLGKFGMTPADRTKIVVPKAKKQNAFGAL